jgi:hypothetical protein
MEGMKMRTDKKHGERFDITSAPRPVSVRALHGGKKELIEAYGQTGISSNFNHSEGAKDPHFHKHNSIGEC